MISVFAAGGRNEGTNVFETQWAEMLYFLSIVSVFLNL